MNQYELGRELFLEVLKIRDADFFGRDMDANLLGLAVSVLEKKDVLDDRKLILMATSFVKNILKEWDSMDARIVALSIGANYSAEKIAKALRISRAEAVRGIVGTRIRFQKELTSL